MLRNHPDAVAIAAMLILLPGLFLARHGRGDVHWAVTPVRDQVRGTLHREVARIRAERQQIRTDFLHCLQFHVR